MNKCMNSRHKSNTRLSRITRKTVILVLLINILSLVNTSEICQKYKCTTFPNNSNLESPQCAIKNKEFNEITVSLSNCPSTYNNHYCPYENLNVNEKATCQPYINSLPILPTYPYARCSSDEECAYFGKCHYLDKIKETCCNTIDQSKDRCESHDQCKAGLVCRYSEIEKFKKCQIYILPRFYIECTSSYDCSNDSFCSPDTKRCVELFSINTNEKSTHSDLDESFFPKLDIYCKTGLSDGNGICRNLTLKNDIQKCDTDNDCIYSYIELDKEGKVVEKTTTIKGSCECGFNPNGDKYCFNPYSKSNKLQLSDYIERIKDSLFQWKYFCNTVERFHCKDFLNHMNILTDYSEHSDYKFQISKNSSYNAHLYYGAEECIMNTVNPFRFDKCPTFNCDDSLEKGNCIETSGSLNSLKEVRLNACDNGFFCKINEDRLLSNEDYVEKCKNNSESAYYNNTPYSQNINFKGNDNGKSFPGERCSVDTDCLEIIINSNNDTVRECSSKSKTCKGSKVNEYCYDNSSCMVGYYCDKSNTNKCVSLKSEGEVCSNTYECINGTFCFKINKGKESTCIRVLSLKVGDDVSEVPSLDLPFACESNVIFDNKCAYKYYNYKDENSSMNSNDKNTPTIISCQLGSKCNYTYAFDEKKSNIKEVEEYCVCSYNQLGNGYCPFAFNEKNIAEKVNKLPLQIKRENITNKKFHSLNRYNAMRDGGNPMKCADFYTDIRFVMGLDFTLDSCAKNVLGFSECHLEVPSPDDSSSSSSSSSSEFVYVFNSFYLFVTMIFVIALF